MFGLDGAVLLDRLIRPGPHRRRMRSLRLLMNALNFKSSCSPAGTGPG
jgi:hypothetical protein